MTNTFFGSKNFLLTLAGFLVVALAVMAYVTYNMPPAVESDTQTATLMQQEESDETESIEKDLNDTEFEDIDKELVEIDAELNASSD